MLVIGYRELALKHPASRDKSRGPNHRQAGRPCGEASTRAPPKLMEPHRSEGLNIGNQSVARLRGDNMDNGIPVSFGHLSGDDGHSPQGRVCPIGYLGVFAFAVE